MEYREAIYRIKDHVRGMINDGRRHPLLYEALNIAIQVLEEKAGGYDDVMVKFIPKAKVLFNNGHIEESISVFPVFENVGTVSTISGSYLYDHNNPVKKYHPEYIDTIRYLDGSIEYDDADCWIVDPLVKI